MFLVSNGEKVQNDEGETSGSPSITYFQDFRGRKKNPQNFAQRKSFLVLLSNMTSARGSAVDYHKWVSVRQRTHDILLSFV